MADVTALAAALGTQLETIDGLRSLPYLSDTITPPVALVGIDQVGYHESFDGPAVRGLTAHAFIVFVILARSSDRAALLQLEGYMSSAGPASVRAALEVEPTLGGLAEGLIVTRAGPPAAITIGASGVEYVSCPFHVEVHAR